MRGLYGILTPMTFGFLLFSYLLGSLPVGLILSRLRGRDPRKVGSGNIGATNVMRTAGKALGIATLAGDTLKGALPVWLALHWGYTPSVAALAGLAAFVGHCYPVFLRFRGGKGVATSLGIFLVISPLSVLICGAVFVGLLFKWRYVSLGSLAGTALMPLVLFLLRTPGEFTILSVTIAVLVFWKHRENIGRLMAGKENRVGGKRKREDGGPRR